MLIIVNLLILIIAFTSSRIGAMISQMTVLQRYSTKIVNQKQQPIVEHCRIAHSFQGAEISIPEGRLLLQNDTKNNKNNNKRTLIRHALLQGVLIMAILMIIIASTLS